MSPETISAEKTRICVSAVEYTEPVGKKLSLAQDGITVVKEQLLDQRATAGRLKNLKFATAGEAFAYRLGADPRTMFFSGTFDPSASDAEVVPQYQLSSIAVQSEGREDSRVAATKEFLNFREGPGLISIDIDVKSSDDVAAIFPEIGAPVFKCADEALVALYEVLPEARGCPVLVVPSSSSMIKREADGELAKGPGGWRILLATLDASQTPRILRAIHTRCWAQKKHCFAFISKSGSFLGRSLADLALARPAQPDYPTAVLGNGLKKSPNVHSILNVEEAFFDPASVDLSYQDRHQAVANLDAAKAALKPASVRALARRKTQIVGELVERGVEKPAAERAATVKLERGVLLGSDTVVFAGGGTVSISDLLSNTGAQYDGQFCLDPVEPGYDGGRHVGIFYWNEGKAPGIHSFAHGSRFFKLRHDLGSATIAISNANGVHTDIVRIIALSNLSDIEMKTVERAAARVLGLGNSRRELRAEVVHDRDRIRQRHSDYDLDNEHDGLDETPCALGVPLGAASFPQTRAVNGSVSILDHQANLEHMLGGYGIEHRYNVITKRMEWAHPEIAGHGDNAETALFSTLLSLASLNVFPQKNLDTYLTALGDDKSCNPVTDYLSSLVWGGTSMIEKLASELDASDPDVAQIVARIFFIQACAAADNAAVAKSLNGDVEAHFEYVLVLVGAQGLGKTKGLRKLLPRPLRRFYREGLVLKLSDKDSVKHAVSNWIAELGELDATFQKSAIAQTKAFLSQSVDEIRAPYARKSARYGRRTVFVGTVNDVSFLADETGNRRYLPLTVGQISLNWTDEELDQLWAEAWHLYTAGEQWWPTEEEDEILAANAEMYRIRTEIEERIERQFSWGHAIATDAGRRTASDVYHDVARPNAAPPGPKELKTVGTALARLWAASGKAELRGGQHVIQNTAGQWVNVNSQSGKNRGWLLPPRRNSGETAASLAASAHISKLRRTR